MSTNYYADVDPELLFPTRPAQPLRLHIGKTAAGWSFIFQGYKINANKAFASLDDNLSITLDGPFRLWLTSWRQWKSFLAAPGSVIEDEYGRRIPAAKFVEMVEKYYSPESLFPPTGQPLRSHYDALRPDDRDDREWKDEQGYSFSTAVFS